MKTLREKLIPQNATLVVEIDTIVDKELSGLKIYKYFNSSNKLSAIAFKGRKLSPIWNYYFMNEEDYQARIKKTIETYETRKLQKKEHATMLKNNKEVALSQIKVGDIFVHTYSCESTTINFLQVTKISGKKIILNLIEKDLVDNDSGRNDYYMPLKNHFVGNKSYQMTVSGYSDNHQIILKNTNLGGYVNSWSGNKVYQTNAHWI